MLTEEERLAVAITRLRLAGVHPTWIKHCKDIHKYEAKHFEWLANQVETQIERDGRTAFASPAPHTH